MICSWIYPSMLKIVIFVIAALTVLCDGHENRIVGSFKQIVMAQSHPITAFWKIQKKWPIANYKPTVTNISDGAWESLTKPSFYVLHGLWPFNFNRHHPNFCYELQGQPQFEVKLRNPLKTRLSKRWPSYREDKDEESLWDFYWKKHGSCMINLRALNQPEKYFDIAAELVRKHNVGTILEKNEIKSGGFKLDLLNQTIINKLHVHPNFRCIKDQSTEEKIQYILEVSLCYTLFFHLENCHTYRQTCNPDEDVFLPLPLPPQAPAASSSTEK